MTVDISVIVPAYNEAARIKGTLTRILSFLKRQSLTSEVIVVDDGSSDTTADIAGRVKGVRLIRQQVNQGKGAAVKTGMLAATGRYRVFMDADLATPLEVLPRFVSLARWSPVVIASRSMQGAVREVEQPFHRIIKGKMFSWLTQALILPGIKDTQCGFKLFTAEAANAVFPRQTVHGFAFDVELLYLARRCGFSVLEVPVAWREGGRTTVRWNDPFRMLVQVLRVRWNGWFGKF